MPMVFESKIVVSWSMSNVAVPSRSGDREDSVVVLEVDITPRLCLCVLSRLVLLPVLVDSVVVEVEVSGVVSEAEEEVVLEIVVASEIVAASMVAIVSVEEEEVGVMEVAVVVLATEVVVLKVRHLVLVVDLAEAEEGEEEVMAALVVDDLPTVEVTQTATTVTAPEEEDDSMTETTETTGTTEDLLVTTGPGQATRTATAIMTVARDHLKEVADTMIPASRGVTEPVVPRNGCGLKQTTY